MNSLRVCAALLSVILISGVTATPSLAQVVEPLSISTDKETYSAGEVITVNGEIRKRSQGDVALTITAPNGNIVAVAQVTPGNDGMFTHTFTVGGHMWLNTGMYMIKAVHGASASNIISDTVTIEYGGGEAPTSPSPEPTDDPLAGIDAAITGGTITSISPGSDPSIIIIINAVDDGMLTLTIPRDILESKVDGQDGDDVPFNVLVDNNEIDAVETAGATSRTLEIEFAAGSEVIEVLGSWIIPEFGVVAIAVLAVAIVSIMVVSARSKIGIVPRF